MRQPEDAAQGCRLVLVEDEDFDLSQRCGRKRERRRQVENGLGTDAGGLADDGFDLGGGRLHLQDHDRVRRYRPTGQRSRLERCIGARRNGDLVAALAVDPHRRKPGRAGDGLQAADVDPQVCQGRARRGAEIVGTDAADEARGGTIARGGNRLVRALAADGLRNRRGQHGLAHRGQMRQTKRQIDIDRAEHRDHRLLSPPKEGAPARTTYRRAGAGSTQVVIAGSILRAGVEGAPTLPLAMRVLASPSVVPKANLRHRGATM